MAPGEVWSKGKFWEQGAAALDCWAGVMLALGSGGWRTCETGRKFIIVYMRESWPCWKPASKTWVLRPQNLRSTLKLPSCWACHLRVRWWPGNKEDPCNGLDFENLHPHTLCPHWHTHVIPSDLAGKASRLKPRGCVAVSSRLKHTLLEGGGAS